jgi:SWI/SNF-related matrix-associated actin-dependent regulator of chromatin subfamily A-like protein 1
MPKLYDYQQTGADFLASQSSALLADEMGLGKTPQGIAATDQLGFGQTTVIVPAILGSEWLGEHGVWHDVPAYAAVMGDKKADPSKADFLICSYGRAAQRDVYDMLMDRHRRAPTTLIMDECHFLKNVEATRTKAMLGEFGDGAGGLSSTAARTWFLTGTPCPNSADELYSMLATGGRFTGTYRQFLYHFCTIRETPWGQRVTGYKRPDELRALLEGFMLRRTNAVELPPTTAGNIIVEPADCGDLSVLEKMRRELPDAAGIIKRAVAKGSFAHIESPHIASLRRLFGLAKVTAVARKAAELLTAEPDAKLVLFCYHKTVIKELADRLRDFGVITLEGGGTDKRRKADKDKFQDDPATRVSVCQTQAAGVGLTMTAANHLWLVEPSWTPAENDQARRRIYRIGQQRPTFINTVTLNTSLDHAINGVLRKKRALIDEIIRDGTPSQQNDFAGLALVD